MRTITPFLLLFLAPLAAAQPVPSGPHPRLFMSAAEIAAYGANAGRDGTAAHEIVAGCQEAIDHPEWQMDRGGADGDTWPGAAVGCAFAYRATGNMAFLTQAITSWQRALDDDQTAGDRLGCVAGVATDWQSWTDGPSPPIIRTVTHDTGYPIRWYGPDIALTYDWLSGAPGVSDALLAQTRTCLTAWLDYYTDRGYHHDEAGANYNAGYVISIALGAIAIGNDGGTDDHLWTTATQTVYRNLLIGEGLANQSGIGQPAGVMVGGDWSEGWQYGPLSVMEYAVGARALEANGVSLPEMDAWTNSLVLRYIHATVPHLDGHFVGGDYESTEDVYSHPNATIIGAVLAGPSSDQAAAWATQFGQAQGLGGGGFIYNAFAELRTVTPEDYRMQTPAPALWYLSRGSRVMYARTAWDQDAFWAAFTSSGGVVSDHHHCDASNFVFTRGGDHLVIDVSQYGAVGTLETNAISADSPGVPGDYAESQTGWSDAELVWARASDSNVYAARSDFASAFNFADNPSDIPYAHREWVFLPEGEIVAIDRVHTADAAHVMYVNFHVNTNGALAISANGDASGPVGGSVVAIHAVAKSGGTPTILQPPSIYDSNDCPGNYPNGDCMNARIQHDIYALRVPGPQAMAIHVIDGLGASEAPAIVGSMRDATYDPGGQNTGVIGAAVFRGDRQNYVVASSADDGASGASLTYGVPGMSAARHIVFDAPEASDGTSRVTAAVEGDRCVITIEAGSGGGFTGHPLMFHIDTAANACAAADGAAADPAMPPPGGGVDAGPGQHPMNDGGTGPHTGGGCGCRAAGTNGANGIAIAIFAAVVALRSRRRTKRV